MAYSLLQGDVVDEDQDSSSTNPFGQHITPPRRATSFLRSKACYFTLGSVVILLIILSCYSERPGYLYHETQKVHPQILDASVFEATALPPTISYARTEILCSFHKPAGIRESHERTLIPLNATLPTFHQLHLSANRTDIAIPDAAYSQIRLELPEPLKQPNGSHLLFGIATRLDRLESSLHQLAHWAGHTGVKMVIIIPVVERPSELDRVRQEAASLGIDMKILESKLENHEDQYFTLVKELYNNKQPETEWAVIMDDDAFFPSISALVQYLSGYDASKPWYIGSLTEDFRQMMTFGLMGYGGGGIFLSIPLLAELNVPEVYSQCFDHKAIGDRQVADCIYLHTLTKLTPEPRLHQTDLAGDVSGFYESGRPLPLSFHHWKSWHKLNVTALASVASVCGDACLLKRWRFDDPAAGKPWYLTNGFSLVQYSNEIAADDISMEHTWDAQGDFRHSLEPLRPKDEGKLQLKLEAVWQEDSGATVRQFYVRRADTEIVRVHEIIWRR
jgi:hypothetical protein